MKLSAGNILFIVVMSFTAVFTLCIFLDILYWLFY